MKRKLLMLLVFSLIVALFVSACSSNSVDDQSAGEPNVANDPAEQPVEAAKDKEPVEIVVNIFGNETQSAVVRSVLDKMEEENPHITASVITTPWGEYIQKLSVLKLSGGAPDIIWAADIHLSQFLESGLLVDISEIRTDGDEEYNFQDFIPSTLDYASKDGNLYGIPFSTAPKFIMYNEDLFKNAGVETPYDLWKKGEWNYDAFTDAIVKITDKPNGVYGYSSIVPSDLYISAADIFWAYGAELFSEDGTQLALNSPEGEQALQVVWDLYNKYDALPSPDQGVIDFKSGKVGMFKGSTSNLNAVGDVGFKWSIAPLPEGPADGPIQIGYAAYAVMNDKNPKDDVLTVLKALTNPDAAETFSEFFVPSRASVIESDALSTKYPAVSKEIFDEVLQFSLERGKVLETPETYAQMKPVIQSAIEAMIINDASVKDTIALIEKNVQQFLK